jgi:Tol biopolymer transport system component/DNA-binding winged helix-turn-helix (wHTH) protein
LEGDLSKPGLKSQAVDLNGVIFHADRNLVERGSEMIRLSPKSAAVLRLMIEQSGQVLGRDEILDQVWAGRYPTDDVLTHAVTEIRRALKDEPAAPTFIETIPKVGYRLLVSPGVEQPAEPRRWWLAGIAAGTAIAMAGIWLHSSGNASRMPVFDQYEALTVSVDHPRLLVAEAGNEFLGAVSPDGVQLAYIEVDQGMADLKLKQVATGAVQDLTHTLNQDEGAPIWTPDGRRLVFREVDSDGRCALYTLEPDTGKKDQLVTGCARYTRMDISPDGQWLVYSAEYTDSATPANLRNLGIYRVRMDGSGLERITFAETPNRHDIRPRFSPDGRWLAFLRTGARHDRRLMIQELGSRSAQVVNTDSWITSFDWHPNGRVLLMSAHRSELHQMEALDLARREIHSLDLTGVGNVISHPNGRQVIYQLLDGDTDIWALHLDGTGWGQPEPLVAGDGLDFQPALSSDGHWLAYCSTRSGLAELYLRDLDSGEERALTDRTGGGPAGPVWSPDNRRLAFMVQHDKSSRAWIATIGEVGAGPIEELAGDQIANLSWSLDGRWLYYISERSGAWQLWRWDTGGGPREMLTEQGAESVQIADDGQVYFSREQDDSLYRLDPQSLQIESVVQGLTGLRGQQWTVTNGAVYFAAEAENEGAMSLQRMDLASHGLETIAGLGQLSPALGHLSASHDGRMIVFDRLAHWNTDVYVANLNIIRAEPPVKPSSP